MNKIDYWVFESFKEFEEYFLKQYPPNINDSNIKYHMWYNSQIEIDQYKKDWISPINISIFFIRLQMINDQWNWIYKQLCYEANKDIQVSLDKQISYSLANIWSKKRSLYNPIKEDILRKQIQLNNITIKESMDYIVHIGWLNDFLKHYWYVICI